MIPKYVFDNSQTCLNIKNVSTKVKLLNYRKYLYYELLLYLKRPHINKFQLINKYKLVVSEIDYKIIILNKKEINKN
jgi:hypothetical protein